MSYPQWESGMTELEFADISMDGYVDILSENQLKKIKFLLMPNPAGDQWHTDYRILITERIPPNYFVYSTTDNIINVHYQLKGQYYGNLFRPC